jgi:flagellar biosynthesis protein FliR
LDILSALLNQTNVFLLIFARVSGIFTAAPFFNNSHVPAYCKVGAALLFSYILLPLVFNPRLVIPETLWAYIALVAGEFLFGLIFGFVSYLIFHAVQMSGNLLDMQIGFGIANVLDPQFGQQVPLTGNFQFILAMLVFISTNGHHILLTALFASFKVIPLTGIVFQTSLADLIVNLVCDIFIIAFKITMPVLVALLLTDVALAILARTMPQMNIFIVGVPAKIAVGLFTLAVVVPFYIAFLEVGFNGMYQNIYRLLAAFPLRA